MTEEDFKALLREHAGECGEGFEDEEYEEFSDGMVLECSGPGFPRDVNDFIADLSGRSVDTRGDESGTDCCVHMSAKLDDDWELTLLGWIGYGDYCDDEYDGHFSGRIFITSHDNPAVKHVASTWFNNNMLNHANKLIAEAKAVLEVVPAPNRDFSEVPALQAFMTTLLAA